MEIKQLILNIVEIAISLDFIIWMDWIKQILDGN